MLPYLGSSQNYLSPCVSSEPNFNPTKIFGILVFKGSFFNVLSRKKKKYFSTESPCKEITTEIIQKFPFSYYVRPGFTFPNFHQVYILTIILSQQLHNQTQISADSVLVQPFATLMNAISVKWLNQKEDMD